MVRKAASLCLLLSVFGFAPSARADGFTTYTYIGQPFTDFFGGDSCSNGVGECSLSGSLNYASPLPPNARIWSIGNSPGGQNPVFVPLLSFSFTDGVHTLNGTGPFFGPNGFPAELFLETGPDGQIVEWGTNFITNFSIFSIDSSSFVNESFDDASFGPDEAFNSNAPGTWTATPEPSSLLLLGTGLLGAVVLRRKWLKVDCLRH
jgi:hypothetical protein